MGSAHGDLSHLAKTPHKDGLTLILFVSDAKLPFSVASPAHSLAIDSYRAKKDTVVIILEIVTQGT